MSSLKTLPATIEDMHEMEMTDSQKVGFIKESGDVKLLPADTFDAVVTQDVRKSYGNGNKKLDVLKGITLTFPKGKICALLGPSGCGKTTLLRLIIGRLKLDSGSIKVFGKIPGTRDCGIPGDKVGYMPQEIALHNEFTIRETMHYFGRIFSMTANSIDERTKYLIELLHLPKESSLVDNLSLGQKRRVSFAVALLQSPPLLLLDEPTVGVDPVLRHSIWLHLLGIVNEGRTTVVITTHYIEEARQADLVFMMRDGSILTQQNPETLLANHNCSNLEDVFLKLCNNNDLDSENHRHSNDVLQSNDEEVAIITKPNNQNKKSKRAISGCVGINKLNAVMIKSATNMWRNLGMLLFQLFIPAFQIIMFCAAMGGKPGNLRVGLLNLDYGFDNYQLGRDFVWTIDNKTISLHKINDLDDGLNAVGRNEIWGIIQIPSNFSKNLVSRMTSCIFTVSDRVYDGSEINIWLDNTNQQIFYTLQGEIIGSLQKFAKDFLSTIGLDSRRADLPLKFNSIGNRNEVNPVLPFTDFVAPGLVLLFAFYVSAIFISFAFIAEKKNGILDRSFVAGVTYAEIILSHFILHFCIMLVQGALSLLFTIFLFDVSCHGSIFWVILMIMLQGSCGLIYGLIVGILCKEEYVCFMGIMTWFFPNIILSGFFWSITAMPLFLQYVSYALPQTFATESVRAVMIRSHDITSMLVWRGFLVTLIWLISLIIFVQISLRFRTTIRAGFKKALKAGIKLGK